MLHGIVVILYVENTLFFRQLSADQSRWLLRFSQVSIVAFRDIWTPVFIAWVALMVLKYKGSSAQHLAAIGAGSLICLCTRGVVGRVPKLSYVQIFDGNEIGFIVRVLPMAVAGYGVCLLGDKDKPWSLKKSWLFPLSFTAMAMAFQLAERGSSSSRTLTFFWKSMSVAGVCTLMLLLSGLWFGKKMSTGNFVLGATGILIAGSI